MQFNFNAVTVTDISAELGYYLLVKYWYMYYKIYDYKTHISTCLTASSRAFFTAAPSHLSTLIASLSRPHCNHNVLGFICFPFICLSASQNSPYAKCIFLKYFVMIKLIIHLSNFIKTFRNRNVT